MLRTLSQARTYDECNAWLPELLDELRTSVDALRSGRVPLAELAISRHLSRKPGAYKTDTVLSEAAKDLAS